MLSQVDKELLSLLYKKTNDKKISLKVFNYFSSTEEKKQMIKYLSDNKDLSLGDVNYNALLIIMPELK